ncbi:MAG TPA: segregation/condensation protein A [Myxococcota bacterium]|jgi:segregation and condensation protein A|nr:segregation/condensation protein A [Myxococcota bacterium]
MSHDPERPMAPSPALAPPAGSSPARGGEGATAAAGATAVTADTIGSQYGAPPVHVQLPVFEGPLDLLLHLIEKHELDVLDIPIAFVTEEYLRYLDLMRMLNLDVAAEYLLMAATLVHIKSKVLLPRAPEGQDEPADGEGQDPRAELVRRLLEYKKYKDAAEGLAGFARLGRDVFTRGEAGAERRPEPGVDLSIFDLIAALAEVLKKAKIDLSHEVAIERISVADRVREILEGLIRRGDLAFTDLFAHGTLTRYRLVVTFLAILEMARLKILKVTQIDRGGAIYLTSQVRTVEEGTARVGAAVAAGTLEPSVHDVDVDSASAALFDEGDGTRDG